MQKYGNHIVGRSWGGYMMAGVSASVSYPSNTTAKVSVTGRAGFYWIDGWSYAEIYVNGGSYKGGITGGSGSESYVVDSSQAASGSVTVNRGTSDTSYTVWCDLYCNGEKSSVSFSVTIAKIPYSACSAPTSVSFSKTLATPSSTVTLSWSGAKGGTSNAVKSYQYWCSWDPDNSSYYHSTTATSVTVTLPNSSNRGKTYYAQVKAIGTVSGYDSGWSAASVSNKVAINQLPPAPTITYTGPNILTSSQAASSATATNNADPDGHTTEIYYNTTNSHTGETKYTSAITLNPSAGTSSTWYFWEKDALGEYGTVASVSVKRNSAPTMSIGTPTKTTKTSAKLPSGADYTTAITLPITIASGTYGTTNRSIYYRIIYKSGNTDPTSQGTKGEWKTLTKTANGTYDISINANAEIRAANHSWKVQVYFNDGIESTSTSNFPSESSSYYYLVPIPTIEYIYNQHADSNVSHTVDGQFYDKLRLKYTYDTDLTSISKVTYKVGDGVENNATINASSTSATSGYNNIDLTLPTNLVPNALYSITVYASNGDFDKILTVTTVQSPIVSITGMSGTPIEWKPYTYSGSMIFNIGITGVTASTFYDTYNLDSTQCFKLYAKYGSNRIEIPQSYFSLNRETTDTAIFTCDCNTNGTSLLSTIKQLLGSNYDTNYTISWFFEVTNRLGRVVTSETSATYKVNFYENLGTPTIKVYFGNSSTSTTWVELTSNNTWRAQEGGRLRFVSTCASYNTISLSSIIQVNRSTSSTKSTWNVYEGLGSTVMTRSGTVNFKTPYTYTSENIVSINSEVTSGTYTWFRTQVNRSNEAAIYSADSYYTNFIAHQKASNFVLSTTNYVEIEDTKTFSGTGSFTTSGIEQINTLANTTVSYELKLLLNDTNDWTTSESSMITYILDSNSVSPGPPTISSNINYSKNYTGTKIWERLYTKLKLTTTIVQNVNNGAFTITTTKVTYSEPYMVTYNIMPLAIYRKNRLGINTKTLTSTEVIGIHGIKDFQVIDMYFVDGTIGQVNLTNKNVDGFIISGGTW